MASKINPGDFVGIGNLTQIIQVKEKNSKLI